MALYMYNIINNNYSFSKSKNVRGKKSKRKSPRSFCKQLTWLIHIYSILKYILQSNIPQDFTRLHNIVQDFAGKKYYSVRAQPSARRLWGAKIKLKAKAYHGVKGVTMVKILINTNEQITQSTLNNYFLAADIQATLDSAPTDSMSDFISPGFYNVLAFVADEIDNDSLTRLFETSAIQHKVLFLKRHLLEDVEDELAEKLDEIFTLPLNFSDFSIRFKRMVRQGATEQAVKAQEGESAQAQGFEEGQRQELEDIQVPGPDENESDEQQAQESSSSQEAFEEEPPALPQDESDPAWADYVKAGKALQEDRQEDDHEDFQEAAPQQTLAPTPKKKRERKSGGRKQAKGKTPLRYLNKTELLEIILEQEKIIKDLKEHSSTMEAQLAKREIILEESGSIAEAALKINEVFEAAQKAAGQYLESVKAAEEETTDTT